jgi:hypothetical protein
MSWKVEVQTDDSDKWVGNALRFSSQEEAQLNAQDLADRWRAVCNWRTARSPDPVNYKWADGKLEAVA